MGPEGKWIITIMTFGAFLGHIVWATIQYCVGGAVADACLISFFLAILIIAPSYSSVEDYWRKKYER